MTKNKLFLLAFALIISTIMVAKKTKEVQIIFSLQAQPEPWYTYAANVGGFITYNPIDFTPFGTMYVLNALILPKNTIDHKHQVSYLTDRYGNPITPNSAIGIWRCQAVNLTDFDINNLPASGTISDQFTQSFEFYGKHINSVYIEGKAIVQSGNILNKQYSTVLGGYGKNKNIHGTARGVTYIAPDMQSTLLIYKFEESVNY